MTQSRTETLILILMVIVILLMVAIASLFLRMTQLQRGVLTALGSFQVAGGPKGLEIGTQAPDFALADTEGQTVTLANLTGEQVLLAFSSTQCSACIAMYSQLKAFSEGDQNIRVVMVSRGTVEENHRLVEEQGFAFRVLTWEDAVASEYQVPGTPFFYVIDEEGVIINRGFGNSLGQLEKLVKDSGG